MEQLKVEQLEEVEVEKIKPAKEVVVLEYEKLLLAERNRADYAKAKNLVKFGCFTQKQETTVPFENLEKISTEKKYRGLYDLYRNLDNMQLMFVAPLIENNKGDVDENKNMKPYGYDVIYLDPVDDETYEMVKVAYKRNNKTLVSVLYHAAFISYFAFLVLGLFIFIYVMITAITTGGYTFIQAVTTGLQSAGIYLGSAMVSTPLLIIANLKYKKYKGE